ncbi:MAG: hypothetical protein GY703_25130 [Gammaproteobacteria bacterium]|nr:hypothetical protein [Gammaproteobacteria bacterium]
MTEKSRDICVITALPSEARAVNRHYGLIRDNKVGHLSLYRGENMNLVISGVGKEAAFQATCDLASMLDPMAGVWINLGIAGHSHRSIGEAVLISEIHDEADGSQWHPTIPSALCCETDRLTTLSRPDTNYQRETLCDMEAAGFFAAVHQCTSPEKIFCLKVVSDNREQPIDRINSKMVTQLIARRMALVDRLLGLSEVDP